MDFEWTDQMRAVRDLAREFAEKEMRPVIMQYDESQEFPFPIMERLAALGFLGMTWPEKLEGAALTEQFIGPRDENCWPSAAALAVAKPATRR